MDNKRVVALRAALCALCLLVFLPVAVHALAPITEPGGTPGGKPSSSRQAAPEKKSIRVLEDRRHETKGPASRNVIIMLDSTEKSPDSDPPQEPQGKGQ